MSQPVEYAVAVDRYLDAAGLAPGSRRVYRIALRGWAWPLVGRTAPVGPDRRRAEPPVVPLHRLDDPAVRARLPAARAERAADADPRTLSREWSILRSAHTWWRAQGWLDGDPLPALPPPTAAVPPPLPPPRPDSDGIRAVLALRAPLREQALWHFLHDTRAPVERALALDIADLDLARRRTHRRSGLDLHWQPHTGRLLALLLSGRTSGPVFLTGRRAPAGTAPADLCPLTGRARLSYRRAAEVLTAATRGLGPDGRGWTLRQLRGDPAR
ncbi:hypothetical protein [Streptacidiphilus cavernicola]|uniref:Core-binding (CB) domain-containing protein n=1 Tax=Streptacidiphilus cavernicola TaxID=3342716 RepID=A0ABV6W094_9ACTN